MTTNLRDDDIRHYEVLVRRTAELYVDYLRVEQDDLEQVLRFRVWLALGAFDHLRAIPARRVGRSPREVYVFHCIQNQLKDLRKGRMRRDNSRPDWMPDVQGIREVYAEDELAPESIHLAVPFEDRFDDEVLLPATLTGDERRVVALLFLDYKQVEIARLLGASAHDIGARVASVRAKMADWKPDTACEGAVKVQLASEAWAVLEAA